MKRLWYVARGDLSSAHAAGTIHSREDVLALRRAGVDARLLSLASNAGVNGPAGIAEEVICQRRSQLSPIWFELKLAFRTLVRPPDVIVLRGADYPLLPWLARLRGVQTVAELPTPPRGLLTKNRRLLDVLMHRLVLRSLSGVVALTRESLESVQPFMSRRAWGVVSGVGVCVEDYPSAPTPGATDRPEVMHIGFLGTLFAYKESRGLPQTFDAFVILRKQGVPIHWHIIGDGEYRQELECKVRRAGLEQEVTFWGFQKPSELPRLLSRCDLMMALYEPSEEMRLGGVNPMKVWTAMAMAKPSLFHYPSTYNEYLNVPGLLHCASMEPDKIAATIQRIWCEYGRDGLRELGLRARSYVQENVSWDRHVAAYLPYIMSDRNLNDACHSKHPDYSR